MSVPPINLPTMAHLTLDASATAPATRPRFEEQRGLDDLGRPLQEVTFCVVDLETTGGSAEGGDQITEIGAVKVRGGEVLGEFQTLVNPRAHIPAFIAVLTGITDQMVAQAPSIEEALPAFLEFAAGCVLVAHNAPFDVGFLRHACLHQQRPWPTFDVVDTALLARRVVTRDESPNCKLSSLARVFGSATVPNHRALADARATVDVLHGLFARLGNLGVTTVEEVQGFSARVSTAQRRKRHLADGLPHAPGVYLFVDDADRVLYVGTSRDLRTRVRSYFTASETRSRMGEMIAIATRVRSVVCATALEASVRELRLIAAHKPPYNRRSRFPEKGRFLKLTVEPWPRFSLVRRVTEDGATYLGPFASARSADQALEALHEAFPLRQCADRLPKQPARTPCVLAELGKCLSPCDGSTTLDEYATVVARAREAVEIGAQRVVAVLSDKMEALAEQERFEEAQVHRDRLHAYVRAASRSQRLTTLAGVAELVAALREKDGRWAIHVIRHGRLAAAGVIPPGGDAHDFVATLRLSAQSVTPGPGPVPAATAEESELLLRWLEQPGVRLVHVDGIWTCPVGGAERHSSSLLAVTESRQSLVPARERRRLPMLARP